MEGRSLINIRNNRGPRILLLKKFNVELPVELRMTMADTYSSVSNLLHDLNWQPLQVRCKISRVQIFYKAVATQINSTIYSTTFPINKLSNQKPSSVSLYHAQCTFYQNALFKNY